MPVSFTYQGISIGTVDTWLDEENYADMDAWADAKVILQTKGAQSISGSLEIGTDLTITGNLVVNGTTVTINTTILNVADKNITIANVDTPSDLTADGGGITLKAATNKTILWNKTSDEWDFNCGINAGSNLMSSSGTPIDVDHIVNKAYADLFLKLTGGTMSGSITMAGNTILTCGNIGFNAGGVDSYIVDNAAYLKMSAKTKMDLAVNGNNIMTLNTNEIDLYHNLYMNAKQIQAVGNPVLAQDAMTLNYADANYEPIDSAYTKAESDGKYEPIDSAYTKVEGDAKYEPIDSCYTKAEGDAKYEPLDSAYTKSEADAKYALIAGYTSSGAINMNSNSFSNVVNVGFTGIVNSISAATELSFIAGSERLKLTSSGIDVKSHKILNVANATAGSDAMNQTASDARYLKLSGGTLSGDINMNVGSISNLVNLGFYGSVNSLSAATELSFIAGSERLKLTSTGVDVKSHRILNLSNPANPTDALNMSTGDDRYLARSGWGGMSGDLIMNSHKITTCSTPTATTDVVNKAYHDLDNDYTFSGSSNIVTLNKSFDGSTMKRVCLSGTNGYSSLDNVALVTSVSGIVNQGGFGTDASGNKYPFGYYPMDGGAMFAYVNGTTIKGYVNANWSGGYRVFIDYY